MRQIVARLAIGVAISTTGMFGADVHLGTWKYNAAKSKTTSANPIKNQIDVRTATADGGVKSTRTGQLMDGNPTDYSFSYKFDGKEYPVTGAPFDTISVTRIDDFTATFVAKKTGGKYHMTGRTVHSKDGKTRTQTSKGTGADGKPVTATLVYDKQ